MAEVIQRKRDQEAGHCTQQRNPAHRARLVVTPQREQQNTEGNRQPDSKT
jgi:hypothetical protein